MLYKSPKFVIREFGLISTRDEGIVPPPMLAGKLPELP